jgi:hypothetical protein
MSGALSKTEGKKGGSALKAESKKGWEGFNVEGVAGEAVVLEQLPFLVDVFLAVDCGVHVEVIAPAGEFEAAIAKFAGLAGQVFQREIGPLTGKQGDRTRHGDSS